MNTKTKIMFVMQPGGFGATGAVLSTSERESVSQVEDLGWPKRRNVGVCSATRRVEAPAAAMRTLDNQNWIRTVVSLPKALGRSVWSPLTRLTQKPSRAI
ncbi:hypothetical protein AXK11_01430 [Cephaloticoccus primus]|uniref:Uncharacterized protein n=1 Tax=Cephaloticoccus primus TaxID=1548207 RepID=A0A139STQ5_9BACT|nr:hypothetical protein [Cephaloticoccus primus]KXU37988.1 hypothetical protein AXK11_01430 [Cephaloticoccus primus]